MMVRACLMLWLALFATTDARADELRPGYLELTETRSQQWRVVWKAPIRGGLAARARPALPADCKWSGETRDVVNAALVVTAEAGCVQPLAGREIGAGERRPIAGAGGQSEGRKRLADKARMDDPVIGLEQSAREQADKGQEQDERQPDQKLPHVTASHG